MHFRCCAMAETTIRGLLTSQMPVFSTVTLFLVLMTLPCYHCALQMSFPVQWPNGSVEVRSYTQNKYGDCLYDSLNDILTCERNHPYDVITKTWKYSPNDVIYVSVQCLEQDFYTHHQIMCICKNRSMAARPHKRVQSDRFKFCQLELVHADMFARLINLEILDLANNLISRVPDHSFSGLGKLRYLSLNNNPIHILPDAMLCGLDELEVVLLHGVPLTVFPRGIFICGNGTQSNVKIIDMSLCNIIQMETDSFKYLGNLVSLDLSQNNIEVIQGNVFLGASVLKLLDLSENNLTEISPSLCNGLDQLERIALNQNRIDSANLKNLERCTNLEEITLSGNGMKNMSGVNVEMTSLSTLNISHNHLELLSGAILTGNIPNLKQLDVSYNRLRFISDIDFDVFPNLEKLNLSWNIISGNQNDFTRIFQTLSRLELLDLSSNTMTSLGSSPFVGLTSLKVLILSNNSYSELLDSTFEGLTTLLSLDLQNNRIGLISTDSFQPLASLEILNLEKNKLRSLKSVVFPVRVESVDLSDNELTEMPDMLSSTNVISLLLKRNSITYLGKKDFVGMRNLKILDISQNRLTDPERGVFQSLSSLEILDLGRNNIKFNLQEDVFEGTTRMSTLNLTHNKITNIGGILGFQSMDSVVSLDLSFNPISGLHGAITNGKRAQRLEKLNLEHCNISFVSKEAFVNLEHLQNVNMQGNKITFIPLFTTHPGAMFRLRNNPLVCSCEMSWLAKRWFSAGEGEGKLSTYDYDVDVCSVYPRKFILPAREIPEDQFLCVDTKNCSSSCKCYKTSKDSFPHLAFCSRNLEVIPYDIPASASVVFLDGNKFRDLGLIQKLASESMQATEFYLNRSQIQGFGDKVFHNYPFLVKLDLSYNNIMDLPRNVFQGLSSLKVMRLQNNRLAGIPKGLFLGLKSLQVLNLAHNNLQTISPETLAEFNAMKTFRWIYLAQNPWICSCPNGDFRKWVDDHYSRVYDRRFLTCDGQEIFRVDHADFGCTTGLSQTAIRTLAIVGSLIIFLVICATLFHFRHELLVIGYARLHMTSLKRISTSIQRPSQYDAVVIFDYNHHKCNWWVHKSLLPHLTQGKWHFRVHVPVPQDLQLESSVDSSLHYIQQSKSSIFIVTQNFPENHWCAKCFRHAQRQSKIGGSHKVVLIAWGETDNNVLENDIKKYISKGNYLPITRRLFWDRLIYQLPIPLSASTAPITGCGYRTLTDATLASGNVVFNRSNNSAENDNEKF